MAMQWTFDGAQKITNVRFRLVTYERIKEKAQKDDASMSYIINTIIETHFEKVKDEKLNVATLAD